MSGLSPDFRPLVLALNFPLDRASTEVATPTYREIPGPVKTAVRALLRFGGYKPSGRGRPASESLLKALAEDRYRQIHPVVDVLNRLSLESGLPISVLDADAVGPRWSFRLGGPGESYVFNPSGQELNLQGLMVLANPTGAVGSPVKDSQRTKVHSQTARFLIVVWGTAVLPESTALVQRGIEQWASKLGLELEGMEPCYSEAEPAD